MRRSSIHRDPVGDADSSIFSMAAESTQKQSAQGRWRVTAVRIGWRRRSEARQEGRETEGRDGRSRRRDRRGSRRERRGVREELRPARRPVGQVYVRQVPQVHASTHSRGGSVRFAGMATRAPASWSCSGFEFPQLKPDLGGGSTWSGQLPRPRTVRPCVGFVGAEGALVAGDRLATMGHQVASS